MIFPCQVWLAIEPVDMRPGIDGLSLWVQPAGSERAWKRAAAT